MKPTAFQRNIRSKYNCSIGGQLLRFKVSRVSLLQAIMIIMWSCKTGAPLIRRGGNLAATRAAIRRTLSLASLIDSQDHRISWQIFCPSCTAAISCEMLWACLCHRPYMSCFANKIQPGLSNLQRVNLVSPHLDKKARVQWQNLPIVFAILRIAYSTPILLHHLLVIIQ